MSWKSKRQAGIGEKWKKKFCATDKLRDHLEDDEWQRRDKELSSRSGLTLVGRSWRGLLKILLSHFFLLLQVNRSSQKRGFLVHDVPDHEIVLGVRSMKYVSKLSLCDPRFNWVHVGGVQKNIWKKLWVNFSTLIGQIVHKPSCQSRTNFFIIASGHILVVFLFWSYPTGYCELKAEIVSHFKNTELAATDI